LTNFFKYSNTFLINNYLVTYHGGSPPYKTVRMKAITPFHIPLFFCIFISGVYFDALATPPQIVTSPPFETSATDSSITLSWESDASGNSLVRYGRTPDYEKGGMAVQNNLSHHEVTISGLSPTQIYKLQVGIASASDTTWSDRQIVSTGSPESATQQINVYFNGSVYNDAAWQEPATSGVDFGAHYAQRIRNARHSVDITFYNISGDTGDEIASALVRAANFGADVRVIMHHNLNNPANNIRQDLVLNDNIEVIQSDFGDNDGRPGLMHNKFAIIDYDSDNPADTWLITSSWNSTDPGSENQYQNMIEFQDPALAGGYRAEFNQMWGSDGPVPDPEKARFSVNKEVVNPTRFWVDDTEIDIYFSPQANTQRIIIDRLQTAESDIALPLYLMTRWDYHDALQDLNNLGIDIRGAIGDPSYQTEIFDSLSGFADVHDHWANYGEDNDMLLHHKTALIDGFAPGSGNGQVITGSFNWSLNANQNSDENTMIIRDDHITNLYFQEFAARYYEAGGSADLGIPTSGESDSFEHPESFTLHQNYPNPFNPVTRIAFDLPDSDIVTLRVYDVTGRHVATLLDGAATAAGQHHVTFDAGGLASGLYIYRVHLGSGAASSLPMILLK